MGELIDGTWRSGWYSGDDIGRFQRPQTLFRGRVGTDEHPVVAGRYHLYAALACPWAHRTLITRALRGLDAVLPVTLVDPHMDDDGWEFPAGEPLMGARFLREIYLRANPRYTGRVTVPVLWDRAASTIVNNESREIMRMLDVDFAPLSMSPRHQTLLPTSLVARIDQILDAIYEPINNGVYRAGFATKQIAYAEAVRELFQALVYWDEHLRERHYLCGATLTEADVALFTTLLRFDLVYYSHFKCNLAQLRELPNLWRFTRRMYQHPGVRETCDLHEIKTHYYWSQTTVNPSRIIPAGPMLEEALLEPVD